MDVRVWRVLRRAAPLAFAAVALVWLFAVGLRAGWWTTGGVDLGWNGFVRAASAPAALIAARGFSIVGTGLPALIEVGILVLVVHHRRGAFWAAATAATCGLSEVQVQLLKAFAGRLRPNGAFGWQNSFPSGHTTLAALLAMLLALLVLEGRWRAVVLPYPLAMAWSRTALHAHWLTDVVAGLVLGAATAALLVLAGDAIRIRCSARVPLRARRARTADPAIARPDPAASASG